MRINYQNSSMVVNQLIAEQCGAVLIDDTGSPGLDNTPSYLDSHRKTWVAVIVPSDRLGDLLVDASGLKAFLADEDISELHCTDAYHGVGEFSNMNIEDRILCFEYMARLFKLYELPILVQTTTPSHAKRWEEMDSGIPPKAIATFDLQDHTHLGLLWLLFKVKKYLKEAWPEESVGVLVDEGFLSKGKTCLLGRKSFPQFRNGLASFHDSGELPLIQLADFAAFGLNRVQLIRGKKRLTRSDKKLFKIYNELALNYIDIEQRAINLDEWKPLDEKHD